MAKTCLAFVAVCLVAFFAATATADEPTTQPVNLNLGVHEGASVEYLDVDPQAKWVSFFENRHVRPQDGPADVPRLFDLKLGKEADLNKAVPHPTACMLSPDGRYAIVAGDNGLSVVELASMKATKLPNKSYIMSCVWMGKRAAYVCLEGGRALGHVQLFDPVKEQVEEMGVCGSLVVTSPMVDTVLAAVNPKSPQTPLSREDYDQNGWIVCLDAKGRITKQLAPARFTLPVVVSPSFTILAFRNKPEKADGKVPASSICVVDIDKKTTQTVDTSDRPVGITDSGRLLTLADKPDADGSPIMLWQGGKSVVLVAKAQQAAFTGTDVYYVTGCGKEAVLSSVKLPPEGK
jgi:hypothetical protein